MLSAIFGIAAVISAATGHWIGAVICGVLTLISLEVSSDERAHYRGRVNRDRYWAYGEEPDWKRKQRAEQTRREEERERQKRERQKRAERAQRKRKAAIADEPASTRVQAKDRTICPECGMKMDIEWSKRYPSGKVFTSYVCGGCGYRRLNNEGATADVKVPGNVAGVPHAKQAPSVAIKRKTGREARYRDERTVMDDIFQTHNRGGNGA